MNAYKRMLLAGFCAGSTILAFGSQAQAAKALGCNIILSAG